VSATTQPVTPRSVRDAWIAFLAVLLDERPAPARPQSETCAGAERATEDASSSDTSTGNVVDLLDFVRRKIEKERARCQG
jgi:hypothetical protein